MLGWGENQYKMWVGYVYGMWLELMFPLRLKRAVYIAV